MMRIDQPAEVAPGSGGIEVTWTFRPRNNGRKIKDAPSGKTSDVEPGNVPRVSRLMALAIKFDGGPHHADHEPPQPGARHPGGDPVPAQDREGPRPDLRAGRPTHRRRPPLEPPAQDVEGASQGTDAHPLIFYGIDHLGFQPTITQSAHSNSSHSPTSPFAPFENRFLFPIDLIGVRS